MSILITGAEMPKPGRYEAVIIVLDKSTAEIAISPAEDDIGYWKEYPLVHVPPHGRLIDADALMAVAEPIKDHRGNLKCVVWDAHINRQPTIIPADGNLYDSLKRGLEQAINGESRSETIQAKEGEG